MAQISSHGALWTVFCSQLFLTRNTADLQVFSGGAIVFLIHKSILSQRYLSPARLAD